MSLNLAAFCLSQSFSPPQLPIITANEASALRHLYLPTFEKLFKFAKPQNISKAPAVKPGIICQKENFAQ